MLIKTDNTDLGYYLIDQRAGGPIAGMPPIFEAATYTCSHCQSVVIMNPERKRERAKCRGCNHMICDACAEIKARTGVCKTFQQLADEVLAAAEKQAESGNIILLP